MAVSRTIRTASKCKLTNWWALQSARISALIEHTGILKQTSYGDRLCSRSPRGISQRPALPRRHWFENRCGQAYVGSTIIHVSDNLPDMASSDVADILSRVGPVPYITQEVVRNPSLRVLLVFFRSFTGMVKPFNPVNIFKMATFKSKCRRISCI